MCICISCYTYMYLYLVLACIGDVRILLISSAAMHGMLPSCLACLSLGRAWCVNNITL